LDWIGKLYDIEREVKDLSEKDRLSVRQERSKPLLIGFMAWLLTQRTLLVKADVTAKAMDYTLKRWQALTVHVDDARVPVDNNAVESVIRPIALGRNKAKCVFMRSVLGWLCGSARIQWSVRRQRGSGLCIKTGVSCGGNPTSGDHHGCIRYHSSVASAVAARQRLGAVRADLLAPLERATLRP
jgi:hypothetical protein